MGPGRRISLFQCGRVYALGSGSASDRGSISRRDLESVNECITPPGNRSPLAYEMLPNTHRRAADNPKLVFRTT